MIKAFLSATAIASLATSAFATCSGPGAESLFSQDELSAFAAQSAASPYSQGLYWKAEKDEVTIYTAGTLHIYDQRLHDTAARFEDELAIADILFLEVTPEGEAELQNAMATDPSMILLPNGQSMPDVIAPETWAELAGTLEQYGINPADVASFQPWLLSINFMLPPCAIQSVQAGEPGLEDLLIDKLPADTPVAALERWQDSMAFFHDVSIEVQAQELLVHLANYTYMNPVTVATLDAYFAEDPQIMLPMMDALVGHFEGDDKTRYDAFMARLKSELLEDRNRAWIDEIYAAADIHDDIFVAAGALHLGGEAGVLNLLAQDGWNISPMAD